MLVRRKRLLVGLSSSAPALSVVQATAKWGISSSQGVPVTNTLTPTLGNALVIPVILWRSGCDFSSCVDNRGNTYNLIHNQLNGVNRTGIYLCSKLTNVTPPFTISLSVNIVTVSIMASTIEVSGVGAGLIVDQKVGNSGSSTSPNTGTTAPLTGSNVVLVSAHTIDPTQGSITVQSVVPAWTEAFENLSVAWIAGESDYRVLSGVAGSTQSCAWSDNVAGPWSAALAALKGS